MIIGDGGRGLHSIPEKSGKTQEPYMALYSPFQEMQISGQ